MAKAEKEALKGNFSLMTNEEKKFTVSEDKKVSPLIVIIPLVVLFVVLFGNLIPLGFPTVYVPGGTFRIALISSYFLASVTMILMMRYYKVMSINDGVKTYLKGCGKLFDCIMMLVLAWGLSTVDGQLGTSEFIVTVFQDTLPAWLVPAIVFLIASVMSFATGTSWGTYAIVLPIAVPLAFHMDADLIVTIGAVLSGGLFGDHCSPVSDTTILSSIGAECELMNHTWTQLPYALMVAGVSLAGYIICALVDMPFISAVCAVILIVVFLAAAKVKGVSVENLTIEDIERIEAEEAKGAEA